MASFSLNVTFVYDSAELFHNDGAIQFRLGEPVVRIALGLPDQTLRSDAVLVFQQVVDILCSLRRWFSSRLPVSLSAEPISVKVLSLSSFMAFLT